MAEIYGKWEVVRELGKGGQGIVSLVKEVGVPATQADDHQLVDLMRRVVHGSDVWAAGKLREMFLDEKPQPILGALKVLHPFEDESIGKKSSARMVAELEAMGAISHPALIRLLDVHVDEAWFVTEYFSEGTAAASLRDTQGSLTKTLLRIRPIIEAVSLLHRARLVHRDIKPENTFVRHDGSFVLGDCGLAIDLDNHRERLTDTYENVGTRAWMPGWAMESRFEEVRPSFDVFSLGKMIWAMLIGRPRLPLWYHDRPDLDPTVLFKDDAEMAWAKTLLNTTVVEHEKDCLADAGMLLNEVNQTLERIRSGSSAIFDDRPRRCLVCGVGTYQLLWDQPADSRMDALTKTSRSFNCIYCGHVQLFHLPKQRSAWNKD